jgi:hypothetical protein
MGENAGKPALIKRARERGVPTCSTIFAALFSARWLARIHGSFVHSTFLSEQPSALRSLFVSRLILTALIPHHTSGRLRRR